MRPFPYQREGALWLADRARGWLADPMGLGKTLTAGFGSVLAGAERPAVLCPRSAVPTWTRHMRELYPDTPVAIETYDRFRQTAVRAGFAAGQHDLLLLDESHKLKSMRAKRTKAALAYAQTVERVWMISGTPMPNGPHELYSAFHYLYPDVLARLNITSYMGWLNTFCVWRESSYGIHVVGAKNKPLLHELLITEGRLLRRTAEEVGLELPEFFWQHEQIEAPKSAELRALEVIVGANRDRGEESPAGATSQMRRLVGETKAEPIALQLVDALTDGALDRVVVFYHHESVGDALAAELGAAKLGFVRVDGSSSAKGRKSAEESFQEGLFPVFLGQIQACGEALTLTAAAQAWIVEPSWVPDENLQAAKRIHRIGQERRCIVKVFSLADSLDEAINETNVRKVRMNEGVLA